MYFALFIIASCFLEVHLRNLQCGEAYPTVYKNRLVISWPYFCNKCDPTVKYPDKIAVFSKDPKISGFGDPLIELTGHDLTSIDSFQTRIEFGPPPLPGNWEYETATRKNVVSGFQCLPFWVASFKKGTILQLRCLGINPTWMEDHKDPIHKLRINEVFLPGTHNSAVYKRMTEMGKNFELCQQVDVWSQLVYGIRYLDITVKYDNNSFYVTYKTESFGPLELILKQIRKFAEVAPNEVIIVYFHSINPSTHQMLLDLVNKEFGLKSFIRDQAYQFSNPTLATLCKVGQNIVPSFGHSFQDKPNEFMWRVTQHYTLARNSQALRNTFYAILESFSEDDHEMKAIVAHMDTSPTNNKDFLEKINIAITNWFRVDWEFETKFNIIATDNFLEGDLITVAVDINIDRGR